MASIKLGSNGEITENAQIQFTPEERVYQLRAEVERLRAALREYTCDCENGCQGIRGEVCGHKARAALGEKK